MICCYASACSEGELLDGFGLSGVELVEDRGHADGTRATRSLLGQAFACALVFLGIGPVLPLPGLAPLPREALQSFPFLAEA